MSSIIAHSLAGMIAEKSFANIAADRYKQNKKLLMLTIFCALLPDMDVIILLLFQSQTIIAHRGITHSLLFCLVTSGLVALLSVRFLNIEFHKLFVLFAISMATHLGLDFLMGAGPSLPLFAPLSFKGFLSPVRLVPSAFYAKSITGLVQAIFYLPALIGYWFELQIFVPLLFCLNKKRSKPMVAVLLFLTICGLVSTWKIYNGA